MALWWPWGGGWFLTSEVPLYMYRLNSGEVLPDTFCPIEQWLQSHPEADTSWPDWPRVSHTGLFSCFFGRT